MKTPDDLRERLNRSADVISPGEPPVERIRARGRRRRAVARVGTAIAILAIAAGVVFPLRALVDARDGSSTIRPGRSDVTSEPPLPWDPEQNVLSPARCEPEEPPGHRIAALIPLRTDVDPVAVCTQIWRTGDAAALLRSGTVVSLSDDGSPNPNPDVPPLSLCAGAAPGVAEIVPSSGPDGCSGSGRYPVPDQYREVLDRFDRVLAEVTVVMPSDGVACVTGKEAAAVWRRALTTHGFDAWTVDLSGFSAGSADKPCASFAIHPSAMQIVIVNDTLS
jgi:hypothetical protein